jgi:protein TonB
MRTALHHDIAANRLGPDPGNVMLQTSIEENAVTAYTDRPQAPLHPDPESPAQNDAQRRTLPVLVGALAVALVALGVWWYAQRDAGGDNVAPVVSVIEPAPAPVLAEVPRDARAAKAPLSERARPVVADRAARPLAGNPMPEYPHASLRSGTEGGVVLAIQLDAGGEPVDVRVVERRGDRERSFDRAAIEAVRQWRFEPAIRDGKAVPSTVHLPVDFRRG